MPLTHIVNSNGWYEYLRGDIEDRNVIVCVADGQYKSEVQKNQKIKRWLNRLSEAGKTRHIDSKAQARCTAEIKANKQCKCSECDDPHLFSMCMLANAAYLFTEDKRISKCRSRLRTSVAMKKYSKVKLIYREQQYRGHRAKILS